MLAFARGVLLKRFDLLEMRACAWILAFQCINLERFEQAPADLPAFGDRVANCDSRMVMRMRACVEGSARCTASGKDAVSNLGAWSLAQLEIVFDRLTNWLTR